MRASEHGEFMFADMNTNNERDGKWLRLLDVKCRCEGHNEKMRAGHRLAAIIVSCVVQSSYASSILYSHDQLHNTVPNHTGRHNDNTR